MKNINKKLKTIGLLTAMASISLTTGVGLLMANAADGDEMGSYYLMPGATVTLLTDSDDTNKSTSFSLDYTAVINESFAKNTLGNDYKLGVLIAPEKGEDITHATSRVTDICYVGSDAKTGITAIPDFTNDTYTFTASIICNSKDIVDEYQKEDPNATEEEILQKTAELELTAQLYYQVGNAAPVYYGDTVTRSIKNILNEVELRGVEDTGVEIPDDVLADFVGETTTQSGEYYLDSETGELLCFKDGELTNVTKSELGEVENYVLAGKTVTPVGVENVTFEVEDVPAAIGATRGVSFVNGTGTTNLKATVITKVIREQDDLKAIRYDDGYGYYSEAKTGLDVDGYYLLGNNITLDWEKGNASLGSSWLTYSNGNSIKTANAFTGTFDGLGHTLYDLKTSGNGLFGILRGATVKNLALVDTDIHATATHRAVLAGVVQNSSIENVYISIDLKETALSGMSGGYATHPYYFGGVLAGTTSTNSTYTNVVVDVPYELTEFDTTAGAKSFGALPLFGRGTDATNTLENVYLISDQPYMFFSNDPPSTITMAFGSNINKTNIELDKAYNFADVEGGNDEALKEYAAKAKTVLAGYNDTLTSFILSANLEANESTPKQYATLQDMANTESDLSTVFGNDNWIVNNNTVVWNTEEFKYYETVAETLEGEFYIEQVTGALLKADENGDLKPVANASIGATNAYLGNVNVTLASGNDVAFNETDLANETVGSTMQVLFVGNAVTKVQATYITQAIFDLEDLAVLGSTAGDNTGYYVLANDITQESADAAAYTPNASANFKGTFDGRGHKISNLRVANGGGLFKNAKGTVDAHVVIKNVAFIDFGFVAGGAGSARGLFGAEVHYADVTNVYISYTKSGKKHDYNGTNLRTGGILNSARFIYSTFTNVIVVNKESIDADTIGIFGTGGYRNTYTNSYVISESPYTIVQSDADTIMVLFGMNYMNALAENELIKDGAFAEYVTAEVLADGSTASATLKALAEKVAKFAAATSNSGKNAAYTSFVLSLPGGNVSGTMDTNANYQYFTEAEMAKAGNSYTTFSSEYWTMQEITENGEVIGVIPVWAR